ncbi:hypothetical protein [Rhizobium leguminosarum]|uniref:Uncharacterized protein n=1 Tax=Rhizobium leguminosarum TaxID=384 RepID=A0A7K3VJY6_RHILE|nr:hypothetical protein [Rhizobium leguminosarum]NEK17516.1 hypothetical protein [Rhizobium leguminosarum]
MTILKRLLKRPLTSADLHRLAGHNMMKPPLPKAMFEAAASLVGKSGVSLLDYWRKAFSIQLDEIAAQKTWQGQRARLLKLVLTEQGWCDVFASTNDIEAPGVWGHLVSEVELFTAFSKEHWKGILLQRYIIALLSAACLEELAAKIYAFSRIKKLELDLHSEYYREILKLDLQINMMIDEMVDAYDDEEALELAGVKDDVINPLIADQYKLLALVAEQIANSQIDIASVKEKIDAFDVRKRELAAVFLASVQESPVT